MRRLPGAPHVADVLSRPTLGSVPRNEEDLIRHGAPEQQVKVKTLGESRPKLKGHDEESWAENRRADVVYEVEK